MTSDSRDYRPPKAADRFLDWFCRDELHEEIYGDLHQYYRRKRQSKGRWGAAIAYWYHVFQFMRPFAFRKRPRHSNPTIMLNNYFKIAIRNLWRNKTYAAINIFGLTVGISSAIIIFLYVFDEMTFDSQHQKKDTIYRLTCTYYLPNGAGKEEMAIMGPPLGPAVEQDYPEVKQTVRLQVVGNRIAQKSNGALFYETVHFADSNMLDVFTFPLAYGDKESALDAPYSLVLSKPMAIKYFNREDVVGESLLFPEDSVNYTITGVLEEIPGNSHLQFEMLSNFGTLRARGRLNDNCWWCFGTYTYIELEPTANPAEFAEKVKRISANYIADQEESSGYYQEYFIQPIEWIHLNSDLRGEISPNSKMVYVYIFLTVGIFIVLIACINFMNLSTAQSAKRAKEIGLRKVSGAHKKQLMTQFLSEATLLVSFSFVLSLVLVSFGLARVNSFTGKTLSLDLFLNPQILLLTIGMVVLVGFISGSYPAFVLSHLKPVQTLKPNFKNSGKGALLRKLLVVFQFTLSVCLIAGSLVTFRQLHYLKNKDLGFEKERVVFIPTRNAHNTNSQFGILKDRLLQEPEVIAASLSSNVPGKPLNNNVVFIGWSDDAELNDMRFLSIDYDYLDLYNLEFVVGRGFEEERGTDVNGAFILNESGMRRLGWTDPEEALGQKLAWQRRQGVVVGIIKDFHFLSANQETQPFIVTMNGNRQIGYLSLKLATDDYPSVLQKIENAFREVMPNKVFEYEFLDEDFDQQLVAEQKFTNLFTFFTAVGIIVACLGLYGLALFTAELRFKEIGIRKVLGASTPGLILMLSKEISKLVAISVIIALPLIIYFGGKWLATFPYQTDISWWLLALAGLLAFLIAMLTISYQSFKAASIDPVKSIANE